MLSGISGLSGLSGSVLRNWLPSRIAGLIAAPIVRDCFLTGGKLWQNAGKTVPAIADADPVRVMICPRTGKEFTAASDAERPLLKSPGGGIYRLRFDGADDLLKWIGSGIDISSIMIATATDGGDTAGQFGNRDTVGSPGTDGLGRLVTHNTQGLLLGGIDSYDGSGEVGEDVVVVQRSGGTNTVRQNGTQTLSNGVTPVAATSQIDFYGGADAQDWYGAIIAPAQTGNNLRNIEAYLFGLFPPRSLLLETGDKLLLESGDDLLLG